MLVFFIILASDYFYNQGLDNPDPGVREHSFSLSKSFLPIDAELLYRYNLELLKKGRDIYIKDNQNIQFIIKAVEGFKRAIFLNPLHYQSHLFLAKSFLLMNRVNSDDLSNGLNSLKDTAALRASNKYVALDLIKIMVSLWPLLETKDQNFTIEVLKNVSSKLSRKDFLEILKIWGLYSKELRIFEEALVRRPIFFKQLSNELAKNQIHLKKRFQYLGYYEKEKNLSFRLKLERNKNDQSADVRKRFLANNKLFRKVETEILGYYKLLAERNNLFENQLINFKKELIWSLITDYFLSKEQDLLVKITDKNIEKYCLKYFQLADTNEQEQLLNLLGRKKFFIERDIHSFYLQNLYRFLCNQDQVVMTDIEEFLGTISYVKMKNMHDYLAIKKLLADIYVKNSFLIRAYSLLSGIEGNQEDMPGVISRILHIKKTIGEDKTQDNKISEELQTMIYESRIVKLDSHIVRKKVYLVDKNSIEIIIPDTFRKKLTGYHLLQVFINNELCYESYLGKLADKVEIIVQNLPELSCLIQVKKIK
jgi:hypothetical protein